MSIASAPAVEAGAEGEDTERLLLQSPRGVSTGGGEPANSVPPRANLCATPSTDSARRGVHTTDRGQPPVRRAACDVRAISRPAPDWCRQRGPGVPWRGSGEPPAGGGQGAAGRSAPGTGRVIASALASARDRLAPHPALCPMLDSGVQDAEPFVVSAFVAGDSLDVALREYGPANITDALPRMRALADALDSAATAGVTARQPPPARHHRVAGAHRAHRHRHRRILERVGVRPPVRRPYCAPESPRATASVRPATSSPWPPSRTSGCAGAASPGRAARASTCRGPARRAPRQSPRSFAGRSTRRRGAYPTATAFVDALAEVSDALAPRARVPKRRPVPAAEPRLALISSRTAPCPRHRWGRGPTWSQAPTMPTPTAGAVIRDVCR